MVYFAEKSPPHFHTCDNQRRVLRLDDKTKSRIITSETFIVYDKDYSLKHIADIKISFFPVTFTINATNLNRMVVITVMATNKNGDTSTCTIPYIVKRKYANNGTGEFAAISFILFEWWGRGWVGQIEMRSSETS